MTSSSTPRPQERPSAKDRARKHLEALPLRVRLIAILLSLLLIALIFTASATAALIRQDLMRRVDSDLRSAATPVANSAVRLIQAERETGLPTGYAVVIQTEDGSTLPIYPTGESRRPDVPDLALTDPRVRSHAPFTIGSTDGTLKWRAVAGPVVDESSKQQIGTYVVAVSLGGVNRTISRLVLVELLIGLAVITACAAAGWYAVNRAFRPLRQIEDTAAAIADGDLTRRIPTRTAKDEVTSLSRSLNVMLAQIEQSFAAREASEEKMRQFVADASHELRTPLAAVRGYAELYRQGAVREPEDVASAMSRIEGEAGRMGGLVEDLLVLARLDDQRPLAITELDLTVLAADAAQDARAIDPERRISVVGLDGPLQPTTTRGDDAKLRQLVANLVSNALNHTPAGSPIEIAVGTRDSVAGQDAGAQAARRENGVGDTSPSGSGKGRAGDRPELADETSSGMPLTVVEVRDHGPGVDPDKARKVFERFYRADPSRTRGQGGGNGLGLAIAAAIVAAHQGRIGVARTAGGGATFVVELPVAPQSATVPGSTANSQTAPSAS
jgi:two-component system OmpR family sensor kinase